jgi:hypothetical protein
MIRTTESALSGWVLAVALAPCLAAEPPQAVPKVQATVSAPATISAREGTVTINVEKMPFRDALAALADQAGIEVVLVADTIPNDEFSDKFEKLPVEQALQRVLAGKSYLLRYALETPGAPPKVTAVYIVPEGTGTTKTYRMEQVAADVEPEVDADTALLVKALSAEQAAERATALKKYLEEADVPDYEAAAQALKDVDPQVRKVALEGMENSHTLPAEATAAVVVDDADPALRMEALRLLVERTGGADQQTIQAALGDSDPNVRAHAVQMAQMAEQIDAFRAKRDAKKAQSAAQP